MRVCPGAAAPATEVVRPDDAVTFLGSYRRPHGMCSYCGRDSYVNKQGLVMRHSRLGSPSKISLGGRLRMAWRILRGSDG